MTDYPLQTKVRLPPLHSTHISRPRLLEAIEQRPDARLALIAAPAGFGKSSCLLEWAHYMKGNGAAVLWYALDSQDNDPARFTAHLVEAARVALPDVFAGAGRSLNLGDVIADLLNRLARFASPCLLILDDFHQIHAVEIHTALSMMLEHLPENVRVGIGARADPPVQLPRLRARGQVVELRAADLRFRPAEIAQLFLRTLRLAPSEKRLGQIDQLTEGWAAALRLVTLALDGGAGRLNDAAIDRALQRYSTAQRYILDYFADEVFEQQTAEARRFLLDTSVLNVLTPALCTALNGVDGPRILDSLARAHLFIIPLTDDAPVYRYHHLVEDYLRQRLRTEDPSRFKAQHRAASDWYTLHGDLADAVEHALLSEDYAYTADLIETRAWESLSSRGEIVTIVSWLRAFPDAALDHHPRLCLYFSRALYLIGDIEQSESYVRRAVRILDGLGDAEAARPLRAIALNYRATLAGYRGAVNEGLDLVAQAQPYRAALDPLGRVRLANTAGYLHFLHGDLQAAREAYGEALTLAMGIGHAYLTIDAEAYLAHIAILTGQWSEAEARCEAFLDAQTEKIAPLSALLIPLASVALDRDDRGRAEALLREALDLARQGNILDTVWYASVLLADVVAQRGNMSEAHAFIRQSEQAASAFRSQVLDSLIGAARARLSLRQRLLPEALAWAEYYTRTAPVEFMRSYEDVTLARVWLAHGQPERALAALEGLAAVAERLGRRRDRMETDALRALALQGLGRQAAALQALQGALDTAAPERAFRLFLDEGPAMLRLLHQAVDQGIAVQAATAILERAARRDASAHPADTLSEREMDVLRLLASGASNQDIMDALVISLGTVKSHVNHIMGKLDAQNRTEAVAKARLLGILRE